MKKIVFLFSLSLIFASCSKNDEETSTGLNDSDLMTASVSTSFGDDSDINFSVNLASDYSSYSSRSTSSTLVGCPIITVDNVNPGEFPKNFTVDFGANCIINGITRSGSLTVILDDYVTNYGSTLTIIRGNNYYINGLKFEGTIVYENITNDVNLPTWTRALSNGKITTSTGGIYTYNDSRTVQLIEGAGTLNLTDNVYKAISGTRHVIRPNNTSLTSTIITPLIKSYSCNYISEGSLDLQGTFLDGTLDFGDGSCDNIGTYTHSNGQVYTINL